MDVIKFVGDHSMDYNTIWIVTHQEKWQKWDVSVFLIFQVCLILKAYKALGPDL